MADRATQGGGVARPVEQGVIARITGAVQTAANTLFGGWFGPLAPPTPVAPPDVQPRTRDYQTGENMSYTPRSYEKVSFVQLRALADGYDLLRLVIETRKDQVARRKLKFRLKKTDGEKKVDYQKRNASDKRIGQVAKFFEKPDGEHDQATWLKMMIEEMLVVDALSIHPRFTFGGDLFAFEIIDGASIHRVIDTEGRTPLPPLTAYQQILKGVPAVDLTAPNADDYTRPQLVYRPRNVRAHKLYGYPPVEQVMMTVNIALRRQIHQLQYFTDGNIPEAIAGMPENWTPEQIDRFMNKWDSIFAGDTGQRRKIKFVPGKLDVQFTRENTMKDEFDEWLARIIAFAFSIPPNALIKQMNRASGETMSEDAMNEGLEPCLVWASSVITELVNTYFGYDDIEAVFDEEQQQDPVKQAQVNDTYVKNGTLSIDEVRDDLGHEPIGMPNAVITATGPVLIDDAEAIREKQNAPDPALNPDGTPKPSANASAQGGNKPPKGQNDDRNAAKTASKKKRLVASAGETTALMRRVERKLGRSITKFFAREKKRISKEIVAEFKSTEKADAERVNDIMSKLNLDSWVELKPTVTEALGAIFSDAEKRSLMSLDVDSSSAIFDMIDENAVKFAETRAAELVGESGGKWAITETTRNRIRQLVTQAVTDGLTPKELESLIWEDSAFSPVRAEMIARTELAFANVQGNLDGWKQSGVVTKKQWILGSEHDIDDECNDNADEGAIALSASFGSGDDGPPAHPNCVCDVIAITLADEGDDE